MRFRRREPDHHRAGRRHGAAGEAGAGAARHEGDAGAVERAHDRRRLGRRARQDDRGRHRLLEGVAVALVREEIGALLDDAVRADEVAELGRERRDQANSSRMRSP